METKPLAGVKVLELGTLIAAPYAAALFAQFGAEVIKIEQPGAGDPLRSWRKMHQGTSLWWYSQSRNKKSVTLDLKSSKGQRIAGELARGADVLIENFRPGFLESIGLGEQQLRELNPKLLVVRISGYGQTGPYRQRPGFGAIAESMGGLRYVTGYPDRPPVRAGISIGDSLASLYAVIGTLLALRHREVQGGQGQLVDVALYEAVFGVMESLLPEFSVQEHIRERSGAALPGIAPSNTYPCTDGYVIIAGNSDSIFRRLMRAIGRDDLGGDPRLARNDGRVAQAARLDAAISGWTSTREVAEALRALEAAEVPAGRIYTARDIHRDPHYRAREMIEEAALPDGTRMEMPGVVPKLSQTPGGTSWIGPSLGEHTAEVLGAIGIGKDEQETLRKEGVI